MLIHYTLPMIAVPFLFTLFWRCWILFAILTQIICNRQRKKRNKRDVRKPIVKPPPSFVRPRHSRPPFERWANRRFGWAAEKPARRQKASSLVGLFALPCSAGVWTMPPKSKPHSWLPVARRQRVHPLISPNLRPNS